MQKTPLSNRLHIGIFGKRNVGKSTLINALTDQEIAIVSDIPGTTTDPVYKAMEIHEIGPAVVIDTGGIDDEGELGRKRVQKTYKVLNKTDVSLLVINKNEGITECEKEFLNEIRKKNIPHIVVVNKIDLSNKNGELLHELNKMGLDSVEISALKKIGVDQLRKKIVKSVPEDYERKIILKDLLTPSDLVIIVAPLDIEAPKGRLKLPQVQVIRDILDHDCSVIAVKETELKGMLENLKKPPKLVITESQIFGKVKLTVPENILLTSFSVLFARYKGELEFLIEGARQVENLKPNDKILVAEACTHHPVEEDVGHAVIPDLIETKFRNIKIDYCRGVDFPENVSEYKLIIHCGGCMLNRREMMHRINSAKQGKIPVTNYGIFIAYMNNMLERVTEPFFSIAE